MSTEDRAKATAKNLEGKAQEAMGNVTGNPDDKAKGKAKQAEAETRNAVENVKDAVKKAID
ncbi:MAG: CsbD family protein [Elainella sp.]